jgi:hypothetical protein
MQRTLFFRWVSQFQGSPLFSSPGHLRETFLMNDLFMVCHLLLSNTTTLRGCRSNIHEVLVPVFAIEALFQR